MRALRELRKVYGVALPSGFAVPYGGRPGQQGCLTTRKTLLDSNYELPASRGLTLIVQRSMRLCVDRQQNLLQQYVKFYQKLQAG